MKKKNPTRVSECGACIIGLLLSQVVSGAWDKPWLLWGGLTGLDALSTPSARTQLWVQIIPIFMIMHPLLGERPPPREYNQSHEPHSWSTCTCSAASLVMEPVCTGLAGSMGWGWGRFGTAHSDFTAFECPACCLLSLWGCAGLGKQLANVLFKVKKINNTGDMLCFLMCSVERNEVWYNQGRGGRKGRDWSEGKSCSLWAEWV